MASVTKQPTDGFDRSDGSSPVAVLGTDARADLVGLGGQYGM